MRTKKAKEDSNENEEDTLLVTARSSMTLIDPKEDEQVDETLADSLIESMHTCLDTLEDATLHSCDNTLNNDGSDGEDDEMMAEMLPHDAEVAKSES